MPLPFDATQKSERPAIYRGVGVMSELTAYDEAIEAEHRGELRGRLQIILRQGRKQFGETDAAVEEELQAIHDRDRLERLGDAILTAKSWQELLATP